MIVKGTPEELTLNRQGQLGPAQRELLRQMSIFNMPAWPILLLGPIFAAGGLLRGGPWSWVGLLVGAALLVSGFSRLRQQRALASGQVQEVRGRLERYRPAPIRFVEALLSIGGQQLILPRGLAGDAPKEGQSYRAYTLRGMAGSPVVVAMETDDERPGSETGDRS